MTEQPAAPDTRPARLAGRLTLGDDLTVHRLGFGAMQITGPGIWGPPQDPAGAVALLRQAVDLGVDLVDTADSYGPGDSEDLVREALWPYRDVVVATKGGFVRTGPGRWFPVGLPEYLRQCCEMSLRRLRVDTIDLYQLHRVDARVPLAEQVGVLAELQHEGKIRHIGLSQVSVEQLRQAQRIAPIVSVQNLYNLTDRSSQDVLELCERDGIAFLPWFPLANGDLLGDRGPLTSVAAATGHTPAQLALAWLLQRSPVMLPIPGTRSPAHLAENCEAGGLTLDVDTYRALSDLA